MFKDHGITSVVKDNILRNNELVCENHYVYTVREAAPKGLHVNDKYMQSKKTLQRRADSDEALIRSIGFDASSATISQNCFDTKYISSLFFLMPLYLSDKPPQIYLLLRIKG